MINADVQIREDAILSSLQLAFFATQQEILADCKKYTRRYTGTLMDSGRAERKGDNRIEITFSTPYAARVYFTGTPSTDRNPFASLLWCQVAAKKHGDEWMQHINERTIKALGGGT